MHTNYRLRTLNFDNYKKTKDKKQKANALAQVFDSAATDLISNLSLKDAQIKDLSSQANSLYEEVDNKTPALKESYIKLQETIQAINSLQQLGPKPTEKELKPHLKILANVDREAAKCFVKSCKRDPNLQAVRGAWKEVKADQALHVLHDLEGKLTDSRQFAKFSRKERKEYLRHQRSALRQNVIKGIKNDGLRQELKLLSLAQLPEQKVDAFLPGSRKLEEEIVEEMEALRTDIENVSELLDYAVALPKDLENLEKVEDIDLIRKFFHAAHRVIKDQPRYGFKLLDQLAKRDNNAFLAKLIAETLWINLRPHSVDIRLIEAIAIFNPSQREIVAGKFTGDVSTVSLTHCTPNVAAAILRQLPEETKALHLSPGAFRMILLNEELRPILKQVKHLVVTPVPEDEEPLEFKNNERFFDCFFSCFPDLTSLQLPPLIFPEMRGISYLSPWQDIFNIGWKFISFKKQETLESQDERIRFALYRACMHGGTLSKDSLWNLRRPTYMAKDEEFSPKEEHFRVMESLSLLHDPSLNAHTSINPVSTPYLLAAGIFDRCISLSLRRRSGPIDRYPQDLSNNPLLSDAVLKSFLNNDVEGNKNADGIYDLHLRNCEQLTSRGVAEALPVSHRICQLDLKNNPQIDDRLFDNFNWGELSKLDLRGDSRFAEDGGKTKRRTPRDCHLLE